MIIDTKSIQTPLIIFVVIVVVAFVVPRLQFRTNDLKSPAIDSAVAVQPPTPPDNSKRIGSLETDLIIAHAQYLATKLVAMHNASTFFDAMSKKMQGGLSEAAYQKSKEELDESKIEFERASAKARSIYLELKALDPGNKTLADTRDSGQIKGGISPYDD